MDLSSAIEMLNGCIFLESRAFSLGMLSKMLDSANAFIDAPNEDDFLGQPSERETVALTPTLILTFSSLICECASDIGSDKHVDALGRLSMFLELSSGRCFHQINSGKRLY